MTIKELIERLSVYPSDMKVCIEYFDADLQMTDWEDCFDVLQKELYNQYAEPRKFQAVVIG